MFRPWWFVVKKKDRTSMTRQRKEKPGEEETLREERDNPPTPAGVEGRRSRSLSQELAGLARWGF